MEFNVNATIGYSNMYSTLRKLSNQKTTELPNVKIRDFYSTNMHNTLLASLNVYMIVEDGFTFGLNNDFAFFGTNNISARLIHRMEDGKRVQTTWDATYGIEGVFWNMESLFGYTFLFSVLSEEPDVYLSVFTGITLGYGNLLTLNYKEGNIDADFFSHANDMGFAGIPISVLFQFYVSEWFGFAISLTETPGFWVSQYIASPDFGNDNNLNSGYSSTVHRRNRNLGFMNTLHIKIGPTIKF